MVISGVRSVLLMTALTITPVRGVSDGDLQRLSPTGVVSYGPLAAQSSIRVLYA